MKANKRSIESLAPRVNALHELLCTPALEGDVREKSRRGALERYACALKYCELALKMRIIRNLKRIAGELVPLTNQGMVEGFFCNAKNLEALGGLVDDIRDAIIEYQVGPLDSHPHIS